MPPIRSMVVMARNINNRNETREELFEDFNHKKNAIPTQNKTIDEQIRRLLVTRPRNGYTFYVAMELLQYLTPSKTLLVAVIVKRFHRETEETS